MKIKNVLFIILSIFLFQCVDAQETELWNKKNCAVVLTYDDAIDVDLDNVIPALDSLNLKGTFYLIGESPVVANRISEWRLAAEHGHELGNHSLNHPCVGSGAGRSWVTADKDLNNYTVNRAVAEIRVTNTLLKAIDGKTERTFAYPCGDTKIGDVDFYKDLETHFAGARGVEPGFEHINEVNLNAIKCFAINGESGDYLIDLVKQAIKSHTLLVFLFHGVGGGHDLNVSLEAHSELIHFIKKHEQEIWNATMVDVADYINKNQTLAK
ncbi:MAG: polysaccharide deacetylase family protein [Leeuwenhoekiella sp.]